MKILLFFLGGENLYEKFAALLQKQSITTYRVSKDTGIPANTFTDWKNGRSKPKADKLAVLAKYFGVSIEYFLEQDAG
jgi:transcriptional regulator with XRE-family HTH domain